MAADRASSCSSRRCIYSSWRRSSAITAASLLAPDCARAGTAPAQQPSARRTAAPIPARCAGRSWPIATFPSLAGRRSGLRRPADLNAARKRARRPRPAGRRAPGSAGADPRRSRRPRRHRHRWPTQPGIAGDRADQRATGRAAQGTSTGPLGRGAQIGAADERDQRRGEETSLGEEASYVCRSRFSGAREERPCAAARGRDSWRRPSASAR